MQTTNNPKGGRKMILADKIIENRKKNGWSQEELADKLGVSRQSVSKWEGAQSMPDMKKILQLSEIFNVSTDYLLRDEIEEQEPSDLIPVDRGVEGDEERSVSMEEAGSFMEHNERIARMISTGVMLCILSPVPLLVLGGLSEGGLLSFKGDLAGIIGVIILFLMIIPAVGMFLYCGLKGKPYEYLENSNIDTEYGVRGMVKDRKASYAEIHNRLLIFGILLCVACAVPMFLIVAMKGDNPGAAFEAGGIGALLAMCAIGVKMIVLTCIRQGGMDKLLEEGDYTRLNKKIGKYDGIYWAIITAVYLAWSFLTFRWELTWIVWPIAGVLYAAYREIMKIIVKR